MRKAFQMFDTTKCGFIETVKISTILNTMGQLFDDAELQAMIDESDPESKKDFKIYDMRYKLYNIIVFRFNSQQPAK